MNLVHYLIKKLPVLLFAIITIIAFSGFSEEEGKCSSENYQNECIENIKKLTKGFVYLKSRPFYAKDRSNTIFSVTFKRDIKYVISVCDEHLDGNEMIIRLLDRDENFIMSSYDRKTEKNARSFIFQCTRSGKYWIKTRFEERDNACAGLVLGMLGEQDPTNNAVSF